jgi:hypothetical protein
MTTPQEPPSPEGPQGPTGPPPPPQNPYGGPSGPPPPPPYQQPQQQPYGQPAYPAQQPYGVPAYGQPPRPPQQEQAPKGMAITALVLSFLGCTTLFAIVAVVLSVIVLRRGRDGRNHGKGLAIAAIVVSIVSMLIGWALGALAIFIGGLTDVEDLSTGDCITATGLSDSSAEAVTGIRTVSCDDAHDGEVATTATLTAEQAESFTTDPSVSVCSDVQTELQEGQSFTGLTAPEPEAGDRVACIVYNSDGSQLTGPLP